MSSKFEKIPKESDTKILYQEERKFGQIDAMYQKFLWEGVVTESVIFLNRDISDLSDEEIEDKIKEKGLLNPFSDVTISKSNLGFTFANFNFEVL